MSNKIGALWLKTSKEGKQYISGVLQDMRGDIWIVAFLNKKKENTKHPDYLIFTSEPIEKEEKTIVKEIPIIQEAPIKEEITDDKEIDPADISL